MNVHIIYIQQFPGSTSKDSTKTQKDSFMCEITHKIIGLFCKRALYKRQYSAKETYNFKEPANRSHPIRSHSHGPNARTAPRHQKTHLCVKSLIYLQSMYIQQFSVSRSKISARTPKYTKMFWVEWLMYVHIIYMGWLWSVGLIKLEVSFAEYRLFYRALLQKRPIISSILPAEATHTQQFSRSRSTDSAKIPKDEFMCEMTHVCAHYIYIKIIGLIGRI